MSTEIEGEQAYRQLMNAVEKHEMTVLQDEGLYRHLRFKSPDNGFYWFDLLTWPGHLYVGGDIRSWVFARVPDMFTFFGGHVGRINPSYWSEKLKAPEYTAARHYSLEVFQQKVRAEFEEVAPEIAGDLHILESMRFDLEQEVLDDDWGELEDETVARLRLDRFESHGLHFYDTWEWDFSEWDHHFLLSCHAIVWGISKYYASKGAQMTAGIGA